MPNAGNAPAGSGFAKSFNGMLGMQQSAPAATKQAARKNRAVRQIGGRTFFLKGGRYVDSLASDKQIADAQKVEQFSDAYVALIEKLGDRSKAFLAESTELLVVIDGKAFIIVPPAAKSENPKLP